MTADTASTTDTQPAATPAAPAGDLRSRARAASGEPTAGTDVARQTPPTLAQLVEQMKPQLQRALPKHLDADRMARLAVTVLRQTPDLARCTPESFLGALMTAAQLGLEPGATGEAYLVPFKGQVTFVPGYRGLVKLAWQSGRIRSLAAHVVYERDTFEYAFGLEPRLEHRPALGERGKPVAVYAVAVFAEGGNAFEVMSVADVEQIRQGAQGRNSPAWRDHWSEMARKTVMRRLCKWLPLSPEVQRALAQDGAVRTDLSTDAIDEVTFIEGELVDPEEQS